MGWAVEDRPKVEELKVAMTQAREKVYAVKSKISEIKHSEKREAMASALEQAESLMQKAYDQLYEIDNHLAR